jgi:hypothetical protein
MLRNDLTGRKFGELDVLAFVGCIGKKARYRVKCSCGREQINPYQDLLEGKTTRCKACHAQDKANRLRQLSFERRKNGFLPAERPVEFGPHSLIKVGGPLRREFNSWESMIRRCYSRTHKSYGYYGGRGIGVCDRWVYSFPAFVEDMGARPAGTTLDRRDNSGNYTKSNCRWIGPKAQASNRRQRMQSVQPQKLLAA